jgi:hypothetical protein
VKEFLRKKGKMFQKRELFFDDDGFDRAGLGCLFALRLQILGNGFHLRYRHIPFHFKDFRTDLHTGFIPHTGFFVNAYFHLFPLSLKGIPPSLEIINLLAFRTFEIFEIFIIIRLILNGSGSNAIDLLSAIAG